MEMDAIGFLGAYVLVGILLLVDLIVKIVPIGLVIVWFLNGRKKIDATIFKKYKVLTIAYLLLAVPVILINLTMYWKNYTQKTTIQHVSQMRTVQECNQIDNYDARNECKFTFLKKAVPDINCDKPASVFKNAIQSFKTSACLRYYAKELKDEQWCPGDSPDNLCMLDVLMRKSDVSLCKSFNWATDSSNDWTQYCIDSVTAAQEKNPILCEKLKSTVGRGGYQNCVTEIATANHDQTMCKTQFTDEKDKYALSACLFWFSPNK